MVSCSTINKAQFSPDPQISSSGCTTRLWTCVICVFQDSTSSTEPKVALAHPRLLATVDQLSTFQLSDPVSRLVKYGLTSPPSMEGSALQTRPSVTKSWTSSSKLSPLEFLVKFLITYTPAWLTRILHPWWVFKLLNVLNQSADQSLTGQAMAAIPASHGTSSSSRGNGSTLTAFAAASLSAPSTHELNGHGGNSSNWLT